MFARFVTLLPLAALAAVVAAAPNAPEARTTAPVCNSGSEYCCNQKFSNKTDFTKDPASLIGLLLSVPLNLGVSCTPVTVIGGLNNAQFSSQAHQLSKRHIAQTRRPHLHLGHVEFIIDRGRDVDATVARNVDVIIDGFHGVQPSALKSTLAYKTMLIKKELCTFFLDPDGASDNRDDLAKTLRSSFRVFCINFANERLQKFIQKCIFESRVDEYQTEGISRFVPSVPYFDNAEGVRLLQNKPGGLNHIMDDQARRSHKKTDHTMVEAFGKRWGNHSLASFKVGAIDRSGFPTFTVNHFNGPVTNSSEGSLARNLYSLNPDFVLLLRGSSVGTSDDGTDGAAGGSINPAVEGLISSKVIAAQAHPIVSVRQPVKPMRAELTRRKVTIKPMAMLREDGAVEEQEREQEDASNPSLNGAVGPKMTQYRYLGQRAGTGARTNGVRDDNANCFEQLKRLSSSSGHLSGMLPKRASPLQLFSNHIKFIVDRGRDVEAAVARSVDVLGIIAGFLGVRPCALESTLAYKTKLVKKELCTFFLDPDLSVLVHAFCYQ
ncbi:P-loop containing nucleoside triphosphate hydrolase protein [Boletus reticuloceps]|uniref:P-loop containing nucleoside triphosphate hydrolase protein n=1 Tax=Boletus reticuloceps TaxID=495285 RepID=A0A8I2YZW1_9AGAM|nr:P-loop containing nucleoside triphosphate hydrolase protein [Boletus reticuloceps]